VTVPTTILLVHGAWHGAWCWAALQAELDRRGVPSLAVELPGHGASREPFGDLYGDAQTVADVLDRLDRPVVLVGHSYGGAVITEAATRHPADVAHLVYLTAFCLDEGEALLPMVQAKLPQVEVPIAGGFHTSEDGSMLIMDESYCVPAFYGECSPQVAAAAIARLCPQPTASFVQPVTGAPWKTLPSTYVRCTLDGAIHIDQQDWMARRCADVVTIETDHSPFASRPVETADILERLARA
jgi:pimeloyl-ACP methyl ester carboxylesterase